MKAVTEIKYQTSDGRQFNSPVKAATHEIDLFVKGKLGVDVKATAPKLIESMVADPEAWIEKLREFVDEDEAASEDAA